MVGVGRAAISRPCWTARILFPSRDGPPSDQGWLRAQDVRARRVLKVCAGNACPFGRFVWFPSGLLRTRVVLRSGITTHLAGARFAACCAQTLGVELARRWNRRFPLDGLQNHVATEEKRCRRRNFEETAEGRGVKLSANILAGYRVLSAVWACPPHDGVPCHRGRQSAVRQPRVP